MSSKSRRIKAKRQYEVAKKSPLGSGKRFAAVKASAKASGARNPAAVAASIGRKKHGKRKMAQLSAQGRRRKRSR